MPQRKLKYSSGNSPNMLQKYTHLLKYVKYVTFCNIIRKQ